MRNIENQTRNLFVSLGSEIDIERFFQYSKNMQIEELMKPKEFIYFQVLNLNLANVLCQDFIKFYNLGGSNWIGGRIIDEHNNFVARISYNGRVWDNEDWKIAKEIVI